jgi:hypothetical protein
LLRALGFRAGLSELVRAFKMAWPLFTEWLGLPVVLNVVFTRGILPVLVLSAVCTTACAAAVW